MGKIRTLTQRRIAPEQVTGPHDTVGVRRVWVSGSTEEAPRSILLVRNQPNRLNAIEDMNAHVAFLVVSQRRCHSCVLT
jgi:hypothetical protein